MRCDKLGAKLALSRAVHRAAPSLPSDRAYRSPRVTFATRSLTEPVHVPVTTASAGGDHRADPYIQGQADRLP